MAPKAITSGKGRMQRHPGVGPGQPLMTAKTQLSPGLFLLEQRHLFTLVGLMATTAFAIGKGTMEAVEPHLITGLFVAGEAYVPFLADQKDPLGGLVGCMTVQTLAFAGRIVHHRTGDKIGPGVTLETECLWISLEQGLDLRAMAIMA